MSNKNRLKYNKNTFNAEYYDKLHIATYLNSCFIRMFYTIAKLIVFYYS